MLFAPRKLASANAGTDTATYPETTTIANGDFSVPFAPGNLYRQVTVTITPTNSAGSAIIQSRPTNADAWANLTEIDMTDGAKSENLTMPSGQVRVKNNGNSGITVAVDGLMNN